VVLTCKANVASSGKILTKLLPFIERGREEALAALRDRIGLDKWVVEVVADKSTPLELLRDMLEVVGTLVRSPACAVVLADTLLPVLVRILPVIAAQPALVPVTAWVLNGLYWTADLTETLAQHTEFFEFVINVLTGNIPCATPDGALQARLSTAWTCIRVVGKDVPVHVRTFYREMHGVDAILYMLATSAFDELEDGDVTEHALDQIQAIIEDDPKRGALMAEHQLVTPTLVRIATTSKASASAKACARALYMTYFSPRHDTA
jgi:hypothetical protein